MIIQGQAASTIDLRRSCWQGRAAKNIFGNVVGGWLRVRPPPSPAINSRPRRLACVSVACIPRGFLVTFFRVSPAYSQCIYMIGGGVLWNLGSTFFWFVGCLVGSVDGVSFLFRSFPVVVAVVVGTAVHRWKGNLVQNMHTHTCLVSL